MNIIGLGYVGLTAPDLAQWLTFARDVIGLDPGRAPGGPAFESDGADGLGRDGSLFFRIDDWTWRLAIHPASEGERPGLAYLGFEVGGEAELAAALEELAQAGFSARRGTARDALDRAVTGIGFTTDPGGHSIELFYGPQVSHGYRNSRGIEFLTGALGMGHVNLFASDSKASIDFYTRVLGFELTDYYSLGEDQSVNFFHVNPRHHTVGVASMVPFDALHHLMLEVTKLDMVGLAYDRAKAAGCKITASLGRHSNDRIISFYVESPSGVEMEIGWGAIQLGPDWTPSFRAPGDVWGHHGLTADALAEAGDGMQ